MNPMKDETVPDDAPEMRDDLVHWLLSPSTREPQDQINALLKLKQAAVSDLATIRHNYLGLCSMIANCRTFLVKLGVPMGPPAPNVKDEASLVMAAAMAAAEGKEYVPYKADVEKNKRIKELEKTVAGYEVGIAAVEKERDALKDELGLHFDKAQGNYCAWQGDGSDHLESLVHACPVVIRARDLKAMCDKLKAFGEVAINVVPGPDGGGEEVPSTPESLTAIIEEMQKEWDNAETRVVQQRTLHEQALLEIEGLKKANALLNRGMEVSEEGRMAFKIQARNAESERDRFERERDAARLIIASYQQADPVGALIAILSHVDGDPIVGTTEEGSYARGRESISIISGNGAKDSVVEATRIRQMEDAISTLRMYCADDGTSDIDKKEILEILNAKGAS